jgi:hypothetical protein
MGFLRQQARAGIEIPITHMHRLDPKVGQGESDVGIQPVSRVSRVQPSDARLIVVSNRLPLTLRKTDGGWNTERSSGGLARAMNPLLRKGGGNWIGWAGDSEDEDKERREAVLKEWLLRRLCQPNGSAHLP